MKGFLEIIFKVLYFLLIICIIEVADEFNNFLERC